MTRTIALTIAILGICLCYAGALSFGATVDLPQTGQTGCWDASGSPIGCGGTGQDADTLMGAAWPSPRFFDNGDQTITDKLTGLIWAKNANIMPVRDAGWDTDGTLDDGRVSWQHGLDYVVKLNAENYLSHNDWRLPNVKELKSLSLGAQSNMATWLNGQGFTDVQSNYYWSSTTYAYPTTYSWYASMAGGTSKGTYKTNYYYVWPVRGGQSGAPDPTYPSNVPKTGQILSYDTNTPQKDDGALQTGVSWPSPRFNDNGDGTVTDNLTGLVWLKNANCTETVGGVTKGSGYLTWEDALTWSNNLSDGNCGLTDSSTAGDWRLPNKEELRSIYDYSESYPALTLGPPFTNVQSLYYWSSTTYPAILYYAWLSNAAVGNEDAADKLNLAFAWPVRGGISGGGTAVCGNGIVELSEQCDDGNTSNGDGCSSTCTIESGYTCAGSPSACVTTCGDGIMAGIEQCDDGNTSNGDGCSSTCTMESGYTCTGSPSLCTLDSYAITTSSDPNGSVSCTPNPVTYGSDSTCEISAHTGYDIATVTVDSVLQDPAPSGYTFYNVTSTHGVEATFADTTAPLLTVSTLPDGSWTGNSTLNVSGTASDNGSGLKDVTINGSPVTVTDGAFSGVVVLSAGANVITVIATDNADNATSDTRTINYDSTVPVIVIQEPADNTKTNIQTIAASGYVNANSTVTGVMNNSLPVSFSFNPADGTFSTSVTLSYGTNTIEVTAENLAHTTASQTRTVTYDNLSPALSVTQPPQDISTNQADMTIQGEVTDLTIPTVSISIDGGAPESLSVTSGQFEKAITFTEEKTYVITVTAVDEAGNSSTVTRNVVYSFDRTPDQFTFTDQTDVFLNAEIISNSITVTGIAAPVGISVTGGTYSIDGGAFTSSSGMVNNGDTVRVMQISSRDYSTTTDTILTIGSVSDTFSVTTISSANEPPTCGRSALSFSDKTVSFTDASSDDGVGGAAAVWVNWGDNRIDSWALLANISHTYAYNGTYTVRQSVKDAQGLISSCDPITVTVPASFKVIVNTTAPTSSAYVKVTLNGTVKAQGYTNASGTWTSTGLAPNANYVMTISKTSKTFTCTGGIGTNPVMVDLSSSNQTLSCAVTP